MVGFKELWVDEIKGQLELKLNWTSAELIKAKLLLKSEYYMVQYSSTTSHIITMNHKIDYDSFEDLSHTVQQHMSVSCVNECLGE